MTEARADRTVPSLRLTVIGCALLAVIACGGGGLLDRGRPLTFGHDLLASYAAGRLVAEGRAGSMYDEAVVEATVRRITVDANLTGEPAHAKWLNPACLAVLFSPLATLPYRHALLLWTALNAGLFGGALHTILRWMPDGSTMRRRPFLLAVLASCPCFLAIEHQQNTFVSLAILTAAATAWRSGSALRTGLLIGLLAYKPHLAAAVGLAAAFSLGWRAVAGMAAGGLSLLAIGEIASPGLTYGFLTGVPKIAAGVLSDPSYNWGRQLTPMAAWRVVLGQASSTVTVLSTVTSVVVLVVVARTAWRSRHGAGRDAAIATAVVAAPMVAPYFMDYDLLLLVIPAALTLGTAGGGWKATIPWAALWVVAYVNVDLVRTVGVNGVTFLMAGILVWRPWALARAANGAAEERTPEVDLQDVRGTGTSIATLPLVAR